MQRRYRALAAAALVLLQACAVAGGGSAPKTAAPPSFGPTTGSTAPATPDVAAAEVVTVSEAAPGQPSFFGGSAGDRGESRNLLAKEEAMGAAPPPAPPSPPSPTPAPVTQPPAQKLTSSTGTSSAGEVAQVRGQILIYTAQITIAVFEVNNSLNAVEALGRDLGGFMAKRDDASITIRVPANRFDDAVKRIEKIGDMLHRNVVAEDVTEEFRDLEVQLKGAHAVQERLTQLLAKATKVEESIAIEKELDRVTSEIDRIEGRMKYLKDRAAYSTITVSFQPKATENLGQTQFRLPGKWLYELGLGRLLSL